MGGRTATPALTLPTGLWRDGARRREGVLRWPADGDEQLELLEATHDLLPAERVTHLVAACLEIEGEPPGTEPLDLARELTAGDRTAVVLALRRVGFGETIDCVLKCPHADCAARLELALSVGELLLEPAEPAAPVLETTIAGARVRFRMPSGADEERAARRALEDPAAAERELLGACLVDGPAAPPPGFADAVSAAMAVADPQAEILLALTCPDCGRAGKVALDPAAMLLHDLWQRVAELEREVHVLASRYGWSERAIVALGGRRRRRYIDLVGGVAP